MSWILLIYIGIGAQSPAIIELASQKACMAAQKTIVETIAMERTFVWTECIDQTTGMVIGWSPDNDAIEKAAEAAAKTKP